MSITIMRREPVAGGAAGVGTVSFLAGSTADVSVSSPMASPGMPIATVLWIDGREHRVSHDIRASLLDTLRHLGLTGPRRGCDDGQCGACMVHMDGKLARACLTLMVAAQGQAITTIEGSAPVDPRLPIGKAVEPPRGHAEGG